MKYGKAAQLLLNDDERSHGQVIVKLLKGTKRMECLVAFAKTSALSDLLKPLRKELGRGLEARFAIGLNFHLTEPEALRKLLALTEKHALALYLSNSSDTFHPKIYAFQHSKQCSVIVGSANFTYGGLYGNYEASALIEDTSGALMASVTQHFDALVADKALVRATKVRIDAYEREYIIHDICRQVAKKRAQKASHAEGPSFVVLSDVLELMKNDDSEHGFAAQRTTRGTNLRQASRMLEDWAAAPGNKRRRFLDRFEELIGQFHSGGLHRGKSLIADHSVQFVEAVTDIVGKRNLSPGEAFAVLHGHFVGISRAGINLLTEILHTLDNKRFAVMNQNAVSGLALAGIGEYPRRPNKKNVSADSYASYCQHADALRRELGLADLTELDALFNYAYWRETDDETTTT